MRAGQRFSWIFCVGLGVMGLSACFSVHEVDPPACECGYEPGASGDSAVDDDAAHTERVRGDALVPQDARDASTSDASQPSCRKCEPTTPVIGIDFVPLRTRTASGQTVAHMEVVGMLELPGDRGFLLWEKTGRIAHYRLEGDDLVFRGETVVPRTHSVTDCGLSWVVLDPDWEENEYVFASKCVSQTHSDVVRMRFDGERIDDVGPTASVVIEVGDEDAVRAWHNVGSIGFFDDAERSMWILLGEKDIAANAQDLSNDLGSVLRIIPHREESSSSYDPHPDNPFASPGADPNAMSGANLYAWGLRSPWRGSIDAHQRIVLAEVGADDVEEINVVSEPGQNFGWGKRRFEGPCEEDCEGLVDPLLYWDRSSEHAYRMDDVKAKPSVARAAFVGVTYAPNERDPYRGFLDDSILFGDICLGYVRALSLDGEGGVARDQHVGHMVGLTSVAQARDGYLYATSYGSCESRNAGFGGGIYRVVPRHEGVDAPIVTERPSSTSIVDDPLGPMPLLISQTGIFDDEELSEPIARVIRYEPTLPLYSNGSDKERWMLLPEDTQVDTSDRDAWRFPPGTQFWKTFSYVNDDGETQRMETRVIRVLEDGYDYNVYGWRDGDAMLLSLQRELLLDVYLPPDNTRFRHNVPSRFDCRTCHEGNRTPIIGFDELRLNGRMGDADTTQLEALARAGVLSQPLPAEPARVSGPDRASREVVGYLHGNCAHCHNDSGNAMSALSLEHGVALENTIDVDSVGSGQVAGVRIVRGSARSSVLFQAFSGEGDNEDIQPMPPIGLRKIDAEAVEMLRAWIDAMPLQ